jgi:two-component system repressor protein LuxO
LRARGVDIVLLANAFLQRFGAEEGKVFQPVSPIVAHALGQHGWPGNVRELQNLIRRAAVLHPGPDLPLDVIPRAALTVRPDAPAALSVAPRPAPPVEVPSRPSMALLNSLTGLTLDEIERIAIENAIDQAGGSLPLAARMLGVSPSTLYRKRERWAEKSGAA